MKLYFGCGKHSVQGYLGVDRVKTPQVDIVHDMENFPYPFEDKSVDEIMLFNILEHLPDTISVMEELWRICRDGARLHISVPYYNSPGAFQDPTHKTFFTENTFDYFTETGTTPLSHFNYYSKARFKILDIEPDQRPIFSAFPRKAQWWLGHHFSTIHSLLVELEAIRK